MRKFILYPKKVGRFYLLKKEWPGLIFTLGIFLIMFLIAYVIKSLIAGVILLALLIMFLIAYLKPSFQRAIFINNGGYFLVNDTVIEKIEPNGFVTKFLYGGRKLSISKRRRGNDVIIGGTMIDFVGQFGRGQMQFELFSLSDEQTKNIQTFLDH